jgi:hypothetical protein
MKLGNIFKIGTTDSRALTPGEIELVRSVFRNEIDCSRIRLYKGAGLLKP